MLHPNIMMSDSSASTLPLLDVFFQLLDEKFLIGDRRIDRITDRNDTDYFIIFHDRYVSDMFLRHQRHAFFKGVIRVQSDDIGGHDDPYFCFLG